MQNTDIEAIISQVMGSNNEARKAAEETIKQQRSTNGPAFLEQLVAYGTTNADEAKSSFALLLLKKQYLDERSEEEGMWALTKEQTEVLKTQISGSLDFASQSTSLLRRKADIICKCYKKAENYEEMIQNLVSLLKWDQGSKEEIVKRKQFAMYNFEILSEYHLSQEHIVEHSSQFLELFSNTLQEDDIHVKVAALKAITSFLSSIDDEAVVLKYKGMMEGLLQVVIAVMQQDETQGQASLESMIELTAVHGDIWADSISKLIFVVSEVIKNRDFEDSTR